jgi:hypothetical protein
VDGRVADLVAIGGQLSTFSTGVLGAIPGALTAEVTAAGPIDTFLAQLDPEPVMPRSATSPRRRPGAGRRGMPSPRRWSLRATSRRGSGRSARPRSQRLARHSCLPVRAYR